MHLQNMIIQDKYQSSVNCFNTCNIQNYLFQKPTFKTKLFHKKMTAGTVKILKITEKEKGKNKNGSRGQSALLNTSISKHFL